MADLYKYRIWCDTDSKYVETWAETEPTVCPENNGHTIDAGKTAITETQESLERKIQEETIKTGENFSTRTVKVVCPASSGWKVTNLTFPMPVGLLSAEFESDAGMQGDGLEFSIAPDTVIGAITAAVIATDTVITVAQSVIDNAKVGYYVKLNDGVNTDDLGRVKSIDTGALTITVETAAVNAFAVATPTNVELTVKMVCDYEIGAPGHRSVGQDKIGASHIPAGATIAARYNNISATAKNFIVQIAYLY